MNESGAEVEIEDKNEGPIGGLSATDVLWMARTQWKVVAGTLVLVMSVAVIYCLVATRFYKATAVLQISTYTGQEVEVDGVMDYDRVVQSFTYAKTQLNLLKGRGIREEVVRRYAELGFTDMGSSEGERPEAADVLDRKLLVTQRKDTDLVDVTVMDTDPERAAKLANLVTEVYIQQNLDGRRDSAQAAKLWLQQQLADYKKRIEDESAALIDYQSHNDLADAEESLTRLSAAMDGLNTAYGEAITNRVLLETTLAGHERLLTAGAWEALAKDMNTPLIVSLTEEFSSAAAEKVKLQARYLERMPDLVYAQAKLEGVERELRKEVERSLVAERAQLALLRSKEASLSTALDQVKTQRLERQALKEEYERLKLQLDRSKKFYATLGQRDGEVDLASRTQLTNVRVVDEARANFKPQTPRIGRSMAFALFLGLALGFTLAFVIEIVDDTIRSPTDVSTYLRTTFLGIIQRIKEIPDDRHRALYTHDHPTSSAAEDIRAVRTLLELLPGSRSLRRILVTSADAAEGKTTAVVSLAVAYANTGRRVLIIDADMRRPRIHKIFDISKENGLSSVLNGGPLEGAIVPSMIPGIDVMPCGPRDDGPNELLSSAATERLLDSLDTYDMVLIDTPPSGALTDAIMLSTMVDGVILVVREATVSRWAIRHVIGRFEQVGAHLVGVIVNGVNISRGNSKYQYHYQYKYAYRYQAKEDEEAKKAVAET